MRRIGKSNKKSRNSSVVASDDDGIRIGEVEEYKNKERNKTVLVGIKLDTASRELLTCALVKVANPGDRVLVVHVVPLSSFSSCSSSDWSGRAADSLLSVLSAYSGFCNLKQIDLKLKVCSGSSIRKSLVQQAISSNAGKLIVGVSKKSHHLGSSSTAIAKYCAKKLPQDCSVLAMSNGKLVFERGGHHASRSQHKLVDAEVDRSAIRDQERQSSDSMQQNCSVCSTVTAKLEIPTIESRTTEVSTTGCPPLTISELADVASGWPLLRWKFLKDGKASPLENSDISGLQWAMRLPSRYTAVLAVHANQKATTTSIIPIGANSSDTLLAIRGVEKEIPLDLKSIIEKYSSTCTVFSYKELAHMTTNFSSEKMIGKGGNGSVYKGQTSNNKELAVKILKPSDEILKDFVSEIEIVSSLHNKNIISLIGFCYENDCLMLVYEYLPKGSLEETLHGAKEDKIAFSWAKRHKVAVGIAQALDYLHGSGNNQPVIHRDVKSSNILLSDDFEPKLSDFGLALWASASASYATCNDVAGTFGYLAPECFMYGKVDEKIDVYAFGVVLLELISGRKPISTGCSKSQESIVMWANSILQGGKVAQLIDPCLGTEYDADQFERMTLAASLCIRRAPTSRPQMSLVLKLLKGDDGMLTWARSQISTSNECDSTDDEASFSDNKLQSYINLALLDIDNDSLSPSSAEHPDFIRANTSLEDYLQGRWSRSSSFY
ncbi:protein kinase STUNTED-like [Typha latifolia]|uniref:protein kinase STUNTED-like n=1 Tax=Typha latifolia TaxID=4733 RepID=UPI003C2EC42A